MSMVTSNTPVPVPSTVLDTSTPVWSADRIAAAFLLGYSGSTRAAYAHDMRHWFGFCADHGLDPLRARREHVDGYARHLIEVEGRSPSTTARRLAALSGFYQRAVDEEAVATNPVRRVRRPKVGTDSPSTGLTRDELSALIEAAQDDGAPRMALVLLLALNGLRVSEALGTDVGDLGTERGHRTLRVHRKGGRYATIPLAPKTAMAIDAMLDGRTEGPLFITRTGQRMTRSGAWQVLRKLARRALPQKAHKVSPHSLRHTFVTLALDAGVPLHVVQDNAGHADPRTTRRYDRARHNLDKHATYTLEGLVE
jgi:integrase/recombinase XerD